MLSTLFTACVAALALTTASAAPVEEEFYPGVFVRSVTEQFYLVGNSSGLAKVDGVKLGARPVKSAYVGWGLPYGQKPQLFGYDNSTLRLHAGTTAKGEALVLAAFEQPDGSAAVRTAVDGEPNASILECEIITNLIFCVSEPGGVNHNDFTPTDYNGDGHYELAIDQSRTKLVRLQVLPVPSS